MITERYGCEKSVAVGNRRHVCCSTYRNALRSVSEIHVGITSQITTIDVQLVTYYATV